MPIIRQSAISRCPGWIPAYLVRPAVIAIEQRYEVSCACTLSLSLSCSFLVLQLLVIVCENEICVFINRLWAVPHVLVLGSVTNISRSSSSSSSR